MTPIDEIVKEFEENFAVIASSYVKGDTHAVNSLESAKSFLRTSLEKYGKQVKEEAHNHRNFLCSNCVRITREVDIAAVEKLIREDWPNSYQLGEAILAAHKSLNEEKQ